MPSLKQPGRRWRGLWEEQQISPEEQQAEENPAKLLAA